VPINVDTLRNYDVLSVIERLAANDQDVHAVMARTTRAAAFLIIRFAGFSSWKINKPLKRMLT
jgi:hypothetical protein